jgi:anaerobic dimethyl sulfoxide reductase subunit B (iron-sulfur subunit)
MRDAIFVIDLARCTGCGACSIACKDRANLDDNIDWLRIETHEAGTYPHPSVTYRVVHCFHCAVPSCVQACPTTAIVRDETGWVQIDAELCIACGSCVEACPFEAIVLGPQGTSCKCDGCSDELARGWTPTCVRACPMRALQYIPQQAVSLENRIQDPAFDDHGISPSVLYLRR